MNTLAAFRAKLAAYRPWDDHEAAMQAEMLTFLDSHVDCLWRTQLLGHFTASAWVLDLSASKVLLIHHRKLNRWLQPGGHADGDADLLAVAQREVQEETGLETNALTQEIFDVDIHEIPERGNEPAHLHLDVRFLLVPKPTATLVLNEEVKASQWISLDQVATQVQERSILRMVEKSIAQMPRIRDLALV